MPDPMRRNFLRGAASLGALTFLTGCDILDGNAAENVLRKVSEFNDRVQAGCSTPTSWRRPIRKARSPGRFRSMPITASTKRPRSSGTTISSKSPAWSTTRRPGRSKSSTRCRRSSRSPGTFASKAGARSAPGSGVRSRISSSASAPTRAPNTSGFKCAEGYSNTHRHGDRAASADPDDADATTTRCCRAHTASR